MPLSCESSCLFYIPSSDVVTRGRSCEQRMNMSVEGNSNQHASFNTDGILISRSDKSTKYSAWSQGQIPQECEIASSTCDIERSGQLNSTLSQAHTVLVLAQVCMSVQKTVTSMNVVPRWVCSVPWNMLTNISFSNNTAPSIESTSVDEQEQQAKTAGKVDTHSLCKDTKKGGSSCSGSSSMQDDKLTHLVELTSVKSHQSSGKSIIGGFLKSHSEPVAVGTKPFTKEGAPTFR